MYYWRVAFMVEEASIFLEVWALMVSLRPSSFASIRPSTFFMESSNCEIVGPGVSSFLKAKISLEMISLVGRVSWAFDSSLELDPAMLRR